LESLSANVTIKVAMPVERHSFRDYVFAIISKCHAVHRDLFDLRARQFALYP